MTASGNGSRTGGRSPHEIADRYNAAWNEHDVDAILSMHAPDSAFHVVGVAPRAEGDDAIRDAVTAIFSWFPDIRFDVRRLHAHQALLTVEFTTTCTLAEPLRYGEVVARPTEGPISFDGVDVIPLEAGSVREKITYIDAISFQRQLGLLPTAEEPEHP